MNRSSTLLSMMLINGQTYYKDFPVFTLPNFEVYVSFNILHEKIRDITFLLKATSWMFERLQNTPLLFSEVQLIEILSCQIPLLHLQK